MNEKWIAMNHRRTLLNGLQKSGVLKVSAKSIVCNGYAVFCEGGEKKAILDGIAIALNECPKLSSPNEMIKLSKATYCYRLKGRKDFKKMIFYKGSFLDWSEFTWNRVR